MDCQTIAECVGALEPDEYLIVSRSDANMYVQFAGQGWYGWLAEAACNTYILPPEEEDLRRQGHAFEAPLDSDDVDESERPNVGSPNVYVTVPRDADLKALAKSAVRFPTLGVKRGPEGAAAAAEAEAEARGY